MKTSPEIEATPADEASQSIRDIAAYLRGVADAAAALSAQGPQLVLAPLRSVSSSRETLMEAALAPVRRTMPYDGLEAEAQDVDASPDEPFVDERRSDVRLRVGKLSAEWYEILGTQVA